MENEEQLEPILQKLYDGHKDFSEEELSQLTEYDHDTIEGEDRRWYKSTETIIKVKDKFFSLVWDQGLTEYQDNQFSDQPEEVTLTETTKTIVVKSYTKVK